MSPTRLRTLVLLVLGTGVVTYLLARTAYGELPGVPVLAGVSLVLLALTEVAMAKVVRDRLAHRRRADGRPVGRALHPLQIARAAVLAKASSATGALLAGAYAGIAAYALPRRDQTVALADDAVAASLSCLASLLLVGAALLLERSCRRPDVEESTA